MNDRQLKYILKIAEERNITIAAQKLYISQPSLSSLLSNVERELGNELFDRSITPLKLTYAGELYVDAAKNILHTQDLLKSKINAIQGGKKGRLIIGCSSPLASYLFPVIIPKYMSKNPDVELKLLEQTHTSLVELLSSGSLDLIISTRVLGNSIFQCTQLYSEEVILLAPKSFTPCSVKEVEGKRFPVIDFNLLNNQPFILLESKRHFRHIVDSIFLKHKIRPNIILETSNWETCYAMVLEGLGFTISSDSLFKKELLNDKMVQKFSIDGTNIRVISIYYRKGTYNIDRINDFIDSTKENLATFL